MSTTPVPAATPAPAAAAQPSGPQKCSYCTGAGRWSKDIFPGKPEMVNCPHCHGSGTAGSADTGGSE
ncbi:MAG TPA: hypothetical protein VE955_08075 [Candidatus Dormibacteraeota bacterium]|nr:hypothetical protein [Candidatus Dormibacteraeota bacterium]